MCVVICHKSLSTFGASFHRFIHLGQVPLVRGSLFSYFHIILLSAHSIEPLLPQYSCIQVFQRVHYLSSRSTHPDAPCAPGSLLCANSTNDHRLHHWKSPLVHLTLGYHCQSLGCHYQSLGCHYQSLGCHYQSLGCHWILALQPTPTSKLNFLIGKSILSQ